MTGHISPQQMRLYRSRSLPPKELLWVNTHLFSCDLCFEQFGGGDGEELSFGLIEGLALPNDDAEYERMEAYVDDHMSLEERVEFESHLEECKTCREDVADLLLLRESIRSHNKSAGPPLSEAAEQVPTTSSGIVPSRRDRVGWAMAAAAAVVLLLSIGWILHLRAQTERLSGEVVALKERGEASQREAESQIANLTAQLNQEHGQPTISPSPGTSSPRSSGHASAGQALAATSLKDGDRTISLENGAVTGVGPLSANLAGAVKAALETSRVDIPSLADLRGEREALMGGESKGPSFLVKAPVGVVVEDARPLFSWQSLPGAANYTVSVADIASGAVVASSPPVASTTWKPSRALARGRKYWWQVRAVLHDGREVWTPAPPLPDAKFKVLAASEATKIQEARQVSPESHLLLGVIYAQAGLVDQARREFQHLVRDNPRSAVAGKLLASAEREPGKSRSTRD